MRRKLPNEKPRAQSRGTNPGPQRGPGHRPQRPHPQPRARCSAAASQPSLPGRRRGSTTDSSYWSKEVRAELEDGRLLRYWRREPSVRGGGRGLAASGVALNSALGRGNGARGRRRSRVSEPPAARRAARGRERRGGRPHLSPGAQPSLLAAPGLRPRARSLAVAAGLGLCFRLRGPSSEGGRQAGRQAVRAVPPAVRRCADGCRLPSGRWEGGGEGRPREGRLWARGLPAAVAAAGGTPEWRCARGGAAGGCGWGLRLGAASVRGAGGVARAEPRDFLFV